LSYFKAKFSTIGLTGGTGLTENKKKQCKSATSDVSVRPLQAVRRIAARNNVKNIGLIEK